uniref:Uncharacterized protein n=1 Tax=Myoviridae sp. ct6aW5 TaxID=2825036 RepID=A0A8S5PFR0_9CAUD|nr:MAG TPA: hypothetical protein [Myoviridae sp. ct6aW5]DAK91691.1 MAG TPA: hypothetical protein [Caudoviricetes sp.]
MKIISIFSSFSSAKISSFSESSQKKRMFFESLKRINRII